MRTLARELDAVRDALAARDTIAHAGAFFFWLGLPEGWNAEALLDKITNRFVDVWQTEAGIKTYGQAVADVIAFRQGQGESFPMTVDQWNTFAKKASWFAARSKAASMGITVTFDPEHAKTPDGYFRVRVKAMCST